ncbi:MAG: molybdenum cofactor guanylyltransferase [Hydrococcus sp. Prado102]|jgi:molybdopterin-guanine dinucleotide biosynthesis protein A|nr:molybdenum cofactor guanylyltransferase [Hydrococcus sp. Prado102]
MTQFAAIILAGGQSSRMGRDKALIEIDGVPLLQKICLIASECTSQVYVIAPSIEKYRSTIPKNCQMIQEVILEGETIPHGPLVGFFQALTHIESEWILLLACDLPRLTSSQIKQWSSYLETTPQNAIALLPHSPKGWEPLCGFYRRRCLSLLNEFINQGGRSFQQWLKGHFVRELIVSDRKILFNCNTPDDIKQI